MKSFDAQIDEWTRQTEARTLAVFHTATLDAMNMMREVKSRGGRMPVDTGFLRKSLRVTKGSPDNLTRDRPENWTDSGDDGAAYALTIAGAKLGDPIYGMWTASYARPVNYGSRGRTGAGFVEYTVEAWPRLVKDAIAKVKSGSGQ